jgi:hypothetical protein
MLYLVKPNLIKVTKRKYEKVKTKEQRIYGLMKTTIYMQNKNLALLKELIKVK